MTLSHDIAALQRTLDRTAPGWFEREAAAVTDARGIVTETACLPVRAATRLLAERAPDSTLTR